MNDLGITSVSEIEPVRTDDLYGLREVLPEIEGPIQHAMSLVGFVTQTAIEHTRMSIVEMAEAVPGHGVVQYCTVAIDHGGFKKRALEVLEDFEPLLVGLTNVGNILKQEAYKRALESFEGNRKAAEYFLEIYLRPLVDATTVYVSRCFEVKIQEQLIARFKELGIPVSKPNLENASQQILHTLEVLDAWNVDGRRTDLTEADREELRSLGLRRTYTDWIALALAGEVKQD